MISAGQIFLMGGLAPSLFQRLKQTLIGSIGLKPFVRVDSGIDYFVVCNE